MHPTKDNFECVKEGETVVEDPRNHYDGMWDYNILVPLNDPSPLITEKEVNVATATVITKKQKKTIKVTFSPLLIKSIHPIPNREDLNSSEFFHHQVNSAYNQRTKAESIIYQHAVLSTPLVATLIKAISNK